ncbi:MAG TPA: acyl carrier protein [Bryobacteraceae bacterium]|nr:acyl carrier protein [Bryobacteraceae bacterium]
MSQVQDVIRLTFHDPTIVVGLNTLAEDVDGWDSLGHARLIIRLEQRFGVEFPAERLFDLKNVGELVELIRAHAAACLG